MASSDRTPQYRKEDNLILKVCLQELILELTRWNMVEQYMIKMKDITIYTTQEDYYWGALTIIYFKFHQIKITVKYIKYIKYTKQIKHILGVLISIEF